LTAAGFVIFLFVAAVNSSAQSPLSLSEALTIAKRQNLSVLQQLQNEQTATLAAGIKRSERLPALSISGLGVALSQPIRFGLATGAAGSPIAPAEINNITSLSLTVSQPVFTGFRLRSNVELAENMALTEQAKLQIQINEVALQVHALYYSIQSLERQREILEISLKRLDVQLSDVRNLYQAGQVMAFDTLQVYNQKLAIGIDLEQVRLSVRLANLRMARLLDLPQIRPVIDTPLPFPPDLSLEFEDLRVKAFAARPELSGMRLARRSADIQEALARSATYPNLSLSASYNYARPGLEPLINQWMDFVTVSANLSWSLWKWGGDRKQIEQAQVLAQKLSLAEQELLRTIEYELQENLESLAFNRRELQLTEQLRRQQAERYRITLTQHRNATASTNDLVKAETDLTAAELRTQLSLVEYYMSYAGLRKALGTIAEPE
jgi:outer membrane protein TolC